MPVERDAIALGRMRRRAGNTGAPQYRWKGALSRETGHAVEREH